MPDTITNVTTVDIQMLDENRSNATTIKLDNPKENLTREQVSAAMQPAFANGWFLCNNGSVAMYLGDVTVNQSIKTKLGGEDFYVTPSSLNFTAGSAEEGLDINVSGATIQGYNIKYTNPGTDPILNVTIAENGLSAHVSIDDYSSGHSATLILIILGTSVNVTVNMN